MMVKAALCSPAFLLMHDLEYDPRRRVAESALYRKYAGDSCGPR